MTQAYFNGDFWEATELTAPGESPATTPAKWRKIEIPRIFERFLVQRAYAALLPAEGQNDKAAAEERAAQRILDDIAVRDGVGRGNYADHRPEVRSR